MQHPHLTLRDMKKEYKRITGEELFLYSAHPGDGDKYVFQCCVQHSLTSALEHMSVRLAAVQAGEPHSVYHSTKD